MESLRRELIRLRLAILLPGLLVAGCTAPHGLYAWGDYEECVYEACSEPGGFDVRAQIVMLTELIEETEAKGRTLGPGVRAHLAYLYTLDGNPDLAIVLFRQEIARFPESARFYNGLMERMGVPPETEEADEPAQATETGGEAG